MWILRLVAVSICLLASNAHGAADWLIAPRGDAAFTARAEQTPGHVTLDNGLIRRTWTLAPNAACIAFDNRMTDASILRAVSPEARVTIDGTTWDIGGLIGQPNHAYLLPEWPAQMEADPNAFQYAGIEIDEPVAPFEWKRVRHHATDADWPPPGVRLRLDFAPPESTPMRGADGIRVSVYYEMYDGIPLICTWMQIHNDGPDPRRIDAFTSEIMAAVEASSFVGGDPEAMPTPNIHVETDYAFGGGMHSGEANRRSVRWLADPNYTTQVHYERKTPCLLEVGPELGPGVTIAPRASFTTFRTFELVHDSTDRERKGLAARRMYRTIAPWTTENPLMMHVRFADWESVKLAIDQCADVGFEMIILTFGSGFNIEDKSEAFLDEMKRYADYARERGIEIGGYSLLASRSIGPEHDVVMPDGVRPQFGQSPCLGSAWGGSYFETLRAFYERTGFMLLEHDGNYPGDECMSRAHPGHAGHADSRWTQWRTITDYYKWCRERGIYLNVPDWYYLSGANKCGMGYRETNWSLPRAQQILHTRQNIYDGTWAKTPSMGWMFTPLTQYHGGGAAATVEPLSEHLDHYERMLQSNLALGVQSCYRGPRLYDTDATREVVQKWVAWFKANRDILESDVVHGRRADGRDLDWMLHVNPWLETRGMLVVFNPLDHVRTRTIEVDVTYTGVEDVAVVQGGHEGDRAMVVPISRDGTISVEVAIQPGGMAWYTIKENDPALD